MFFALTGAIVVAVLVAAADVLLPFVLAMTVAFILTPAVAFLEKRRVPRAAAILLVYAATLGVVGGFVAMTIPSIVREGKLLEHELPKRMHVIEKSWLPAIDRKIAEWSGQSPSADAPPEHATSDADPLAPSTDSPREEKLPPSLVVTPRDDGAYEVYLGDHVQLRRVGDDRWRLEPGERREDVSASKLVATAFARGARYLSENAGEVLKLGQAIVAAVWRGVFTLFMTLMLAGYMMHTREAIFRFFRGLCEPASRPSFDKLLHRLEKGLGGVVRGQLIICCVNGVLAAIGFSLFGLKYWPILALVAAVGSIIPIFGSILSAIPAVAIGLTQSPGTAFAVLAWIIGVHQLEANLLNPKIIGDAAHIHPVLVVFSLIVGEHFFQVKGALFAVPAMSIAQTLFLHFREVLWPPTDAPSSETPPTEPKDARRSAPPASRDRTVSRAADVPSSEESSVSSP